MNAERLFKWRYIPPGSFLMGSTFEKETGRQDNETQHSVEISRGFWMQTAPVTQREWQTHIGNNPSYFKGHPDHPVECVSWFDALAYCNALSRSEGLTEAYIFKHSQGHPGQEDFICDVEWRGLACHGYRLPTEAEREYATRAGTTTAFYNGDCLDSHDYDTIREQIAWCEHIISPIAWFNGNSGNTTHPVKQKMPNAWGLYDICGHVNEWCWDWYCGDGYGYDPDTLYRDPIGPTSPRNDRVLRGGSWNDEAPHFRSARRNHQSPDLCFAGIGFRPVRSNC